MPDERQVGFYYCVREVECYGSTLMELFGKIASRARLCSLSDFLVAIRPIPLFDSGVKERPTQMLRVMFANNRVMPV